MQNARVRRPIEDFAAPHGEDDFALVVRKDGGDDRRVEEAVAGRDLRERTTQYARRVIRLYVRLAKDAVIAAEELLPPNLLTPLRDESRQLTAIFVASLIRAPSSDQLPAFSASLRISHSAF